MKGALLTPQDMPPRPEVRRGDHPHLAFVRSKAHRCAALRGRRGAQAWCPALKHEGQSDWSGSPALKHRLVITRTSSIRSVLHSSIRLSISRSMGHSPALYGVPALKREEVTARSILRLGRLMDQGR